MLTLQKYEIYFTKSQECGLFMQITALSYRYELYKMGAKKQILRQANLPQNDIELSF